MNFQPSLPNLQSARPGNVVNRGAAAPVASGGIGEIFKWLKQASHKVGSWLRQLVAADAGPKLVFEYPGETRQSVLKGIIDDAMILLLPSEAGCGVALRALVAGERNAIAQLRARSSEARQRFFAAYGEFLALHDQETEPLGDSDFLKSIAEFGAAHSNHKD